MRCSVCQAENPSSAPQCVSCGQALSGRRKSGRKRSLAEDHDSPFAPCTNETNRPAIRAFRISLCGMVPVAGALLGPVAVLLAAVVLWRRKGNPEFTAHGAAYAALLLGGLTALTNWVGLALMVLGLR
jgi:hypothetical protein